jgi:hypothetical protein
LPCDFIFRKQHGLFVTRWWDVVLDSEMRELFEELFTHPDFDQGMSADGPQEVPVFRTLKQAVSSLEFEPDVLERLLTGP